MSDGFDVYSKVEPLVLGNRGAVEAPGFFWFSSNTLERPVGTAPKAVLITNTAATGVSFNAYMFGSPVAGITNYILFSENIRSGITAQSWSIYTQSGGYPQHPSSPYSPIIMPDGSTNGMRLITRINPPSDSAGIYHPFPSTSILQSRNVYTFSCWIAGDSGGGVYPENTTIRLSYFNNTTPSSSYTEDIPITPTPRRVSYTFVAANATSDTGENIAIGNGLSTKGITAQLVLWGAQINEGNTAGPYVATGTASNKLTTGGRSSPVFQPINNPDIRDIDRVNILAPGSSSFVLNNTIFAIATNNTATTAPPSGLSVYGLY
jgi:hypothetical protein